MAGKSKPPKRRPAIRPPSATAEGRTQLLLEDIRHQNRAVMDAVSAQGQRLERLIGELKDDHGERISRLEFAVGDLVKAVRQNSEDIQSVSAKLDRKADADAQRSLEERMSQVERAVSRR